MSRFFTAAFLLFTCQLVAQNATLTFQIDGLKTPRANLCYYFGDQAFRLDSAAVDTLTGTVQFSSAGRHAGLYFLSVKAGRLFDFILEKPGTSFTIRGSIAHLDSLQAENSPENTAFFENKRAEAALKASIEQAKSALQMVNEATHNDPEATAEFSSKLRQRQEELTSLRNSFIAAHPGHLYARVLRAVQLPVPPAGLPDRDKNGKANPAFYAWLQQHYWEASDFSDDNLLYNNLWASLLNPYFSRVVASQPDSLIRAIDALLAKMPKDGPVYQFTVKYLTQRFEQSDWRNADQVFVHLADTYQKPASTPWLDQATLLRIEEKANIHRRNLTGQPAPPLALPDVSGQNWDLSKITTPYTLLIFYSPLCAHCQESMPGVYQTWKDYASKGLGAVAVSMENYDFWKNYVRQKGWAWQNVADPSGKNEFQKDYNAWNLPVIYLLDKDHNILRKRVRTTELVEVLREYFP